MTARTLATRLESHVRMLAENVGKHNVRHTDALAEAAACIGNVRHEQGNRVTQQSYDVQGISRSSQEVIHRGARHPEEILLVGAHYDSACGSPGANDNGSGITALLEIARLIKDVENVRLHNRLHHPGRSRDDGMNRNVVPLSP